VSERDFVPSELAQELVDAFKADLIKPLHLCELHQPDKWEASEKECPICEGHRLKATLDEVTKAARKLVDLEKRFTADTGIPWTDLITQAVEELEALL